MWKFFLLVFLIPAWLQAQPIIALDGSDFTDAVVVPAETYNPETVWNYLNSDVDLYLEFGFTSLMVQNIIWDNEKVKVEVFRMGSPADAFGVFSLKILGCLHRDSVYAFSCNTRFQYQMAYGIFYFLISGEPATENLQQRFSSIAAALMMKNPQQILKIPEPFTLPALKQGYNNLAYIRGPVGLQNCMFPLQNLLTTVRFGMYITLITQPDNVIYFARIAFQTPDDLFRFLGYAGLMQGNVPIPNTSTNDGLYREYQQIDPLTIYFLQSQVAWPIRAIISEK